MTQHNTITLNDDQRHPHGAEIHGDWIVIAIRKTSLLHATEGHPDFEDGRLKVNNLDEWANAFVEELNNESENGATPVSRMLDQVVTDAIENGAEGIDYGD